MIELIINKIAKKKKFDIKFCRFDIKFIVQCPMCKHVMS